MKWVADKTGRFPERPHYERHEIDIDCEEFALKILRDRHNGELVFPISTDDLMVMIERAGADLDLFSDLSRYGSGVEAVTEFSPGRKPLVRVSRTISEDPRLENRLRTTLTHECGHVQFHRFLWEMKGSNFELFPTSFDDRQVCKRDRIVSSGSYDWMEWQAGYCCGAYLMPYSKLKETCHAFMLRQGTGPFPFDEVSPIAEALIGRVVADFRVSRDAARVRLHVVGVLSTESGQEPLLAV